jgi:molybdopterin synthase sulfur carrier subunit
VAKVLMLGRLRDVAGWRERDMDVPPSTHALIAFLASDSVLGQALRGKGVQVAVNKAVVRGDHPLASTDEVAFLPPMSGG